jgi:hypothetical protein
MRTILTWKNVHVNERLRRAIDDAELDIDDIARATGASHRTVERWISKGRVPQRRYRRAVARIVDVDETDLWPSVTVRRDGISTSEIVTVFSTRASVPPELWRRLLENAHEQVDLLGSSLLYLFEDPGFVELLWTTPCDVRIALADPDSPLVSQRDEELGLGGTLSGRIRTSITHLRLRNVKRLQGYGAELRLHAAPMYCSMFRADDEMLVTPHVYARSGRSNTPVLHLQRREQVGIFDSYVTHFEDVFYKAAPPLFPRTGSQTASSGDSP